MVVVLTTMTTSMADSQRVLSRHYSSIGIGDVFIDPPPDKLLPLSYLTSSEATQSFHTSEIVGAIKSCPEDFVVREIACRNRTPNLPQDFNLVADLGPTIPPTASAIDRQIIVLDEAPDAPESLDQQQSGQRKKAAAPLDSDSLDSAQLDENDKHATHFSEAKSAKMLQPESSRETLKRILDVSFDCKRASKLLERLDILQQTAVGRIQRYPDVDDNDDDDRIVWIAPIDTSDSKSGDPSWTRGSARRLFHHSLRLSFPLVQSETVRHESKLQPPSGPSKSGASTNDSDAQTHAWTRVSIDDSFFSLSPSLYRAHEDLPNLYLFRNRGWALPAQANSDDTKVPDRKRRRVTVKNTPTNGESKVILRLRPDLAREERRPLHHLISKGCREFETSTIPNYCLVDHEIKSARGITPSSAAAIVVKWSNRAKRRAQKQNIAMAEPSLSEASVHESHTLCVMKKTKTEHLSAIRRLTRAIRCRQSDIGLAGIKDMHAVTYQFCTISNVKPQNVQSAEFCLRSQGIELGRIQKVGWTLNQGDLEGNQFEITVRNVTRIKVEMKQGACTEEFVPCEAGHVRAMLDRVRKYGFINFYGEQRLGLPGCTAEVGVRAFDIGRAMLRQDFSKAIDLLMSGRKVCQGETNEESPEIRRARQVWKESGADVYLTLKSIPKGDAMARERIVLNGLKRYGVSNPLAALRCLHFGVRKFWINAYQSYVWNFMASERVKRHGTAVVSGDLYRPPNGDESLVAVVGDDASSVDLADVVLPLPGYAIRYPENEIGQLYRDFMANEKISFDRAAPLEATAKGCYRNLIEFAKGLEVCFDCGQNSRTFSPGSAKDTVTAYTLKFELARGSYATMLLREMMLTTVCRHT